MGLFTWLQRWTGRNHRHHSGSCLRHGLNRKPAARYRPTLEALEDRLCPASATLDFSTYLGGSGTERSFAVAVDSAGNSYVTGLTTSKNFPGTSGAFQTRLSGSQDAFVAKFNPAGGLVYATYLGGNNITEGFSIAVDQYGDAYVTGQPTTGFPTVNALQASYHQAFLTKISSPV
jgi:hypothetical protein